MNGAACLEPCTQLHEALVTKGVTSDDGVSGWRCWHDGGTATALGVDAAEMAWHRGGRSGCSDNAAVDQRRSNDAVGWLEGVTAGSGSGGKGRRGRQVQQAAQAIYVFACEGWIDKGRREA